MAFVLSERSLNKLKGVKPELVAIVHRAIELTPIDFIVTEGLRTKARQAELVRAGASRTMNSRHITGDAIDFAAYVAGEVRWDWPLYPRIAAAFKAAAQEQGTPITWGGDWPRFRDGPHIELKR
jgi:peptidoglycan L-alanyl-D-glutamate endopeptidase CwlK